MGEDLCLKKKKKEKKKWETEIKDGWKGGGGREIRGPRKHLE